MSEKLPNGLTGNYAYGEQNWHESMNANLKTLDGIISKVDELEGASGKSDTQTVKATDYISATSLSSAENAINVQVTNINKITQFELNGVVLPIVTRPAGSIQSGNVVVKVPEKLDYPFAFYSNLLIRVKVFIGYNIDGEAIYDYVDITAPNPRKWRYLSQNMFYVPSNQRINVSWTSPGTNIEMPRQSADIFSNGTNGQFLAAVDPNVGDNITVMAEVQCFIEGTGLSIAKEYLPIVLNPKT